MDLKIDFNERPFIVIWEVTHRLFDRGTIKAFSNAWEKLAEQAQRDGGELVFSNSQHPEASGRRCNIRKEEK
jgi:hypothetical protein